MSRFEEAHAIVEAWEGGFVVDAGGRTDRGISEKAHPEAWADGVITAEESRAIYRERYWKPIRGDDLPWPLSLAVFDQAVHMGVGRASRMLQKLVGAKVDGVIGPNTVRAAKRYAARRAAEDLLEDREEWQRGVERKRVEKGMKSRMRGFVNRFKYLARHLA